MVQPAEYSDGTFEFEELRRYPFCVAAAPGHPFKRLNLPRIKSAANEYNKRRLTMSEQAGRSAEDSKSDLLHFAPFRAQAVVHGTLPDRIINRYYKKPL
jgi:hypothetical protein